MNVEAILSKKICHNGHNLAELTHELPVFFIFLRHLGCTFCREALADIGAQRRAIELEGAGLALVHMSPPEEADPILDEYGLYDVIKISDPDRELYQSFELPRARLHRLLGIKVMIRGLLAGVIRGHGIGSPMGDTWQLPGIFLVYQGKVARAYRHTSPADRPNYVELACFPLNPDQPLPRAW